jgi:hypothetical protein
MERKNNIEKIESSKIVEIVKDHKNKSNKDLKLAMDFIQEDFKLTKENLIKLSHHLDKLELTYNTLFKEYESRGMVTK